MRSLWKLLPIATLFGVLVGMTPAEAKSIPEVKPLSIEQSKNLGKLLRLGFDAVEAGRLVDLKKLGVEEIKAIQAKKALNPKHKRGAKPTPKEVHSKFPKHKTKAARDIPPSYMVLPNQLSYWLNDVDGDCVTAEEAFKCACDGILIQDATVQTWATQNGTLNGADLPTVMQQMAASGFQQDGNTYGDGPYATVDMTSWANLTSGISSGRLKLGVASAQLDNVVGTTNGWWGTGFQQANPNDEDHCTDACGYGTASQLATWFSVPIPAGLDPSTQCVAYFTWDTVGIVDYPSFQATTFEVYLRTPSTITIGSGTPTPDSVTIFGGPTPTPGPIVPPVPPTPPSPTTGTFQFTQMQLTGPFGSRGRQATIVVSGTAAGTYTPGSSAVVPTAASTGCSDGSCAVPGRTFVFPGLHPFRK